MRLSLIILSILAASSFAGAQATQPSAAATAAWERTISSVAAAAAAHDSQALQTLIPGGCAAHRFSAERDADLSNLIAFISSSMVLGDHAYFSPTPTLASDIAHDVNEAAIIPDSAKKTLALGDQHDQAVAIQWLTQNLNPTDGAPIGVIVLWNSNPSLDDTHRLTFILIKADHIGDEFKLSQIVYGDPLE